jgi:20S proteasome alpha/beta subunit
MAGGRLIHDRIRATLHLLSVLSVFVFASPSGGSFVAAVICADGIVVASDSRGTINISRNEDKTPVAYFDGIQKIFPVGSNVLASYGRGTFSGLFFSNMVEDFARTEYAKEPVDRLLGAFLIFSSKQYTHAVLDQLWHEVMIAGGYINDQPRICVFDAARSDKGLSLFECVKSGIAETSVTSLEKYDENTFLSMSSGDAAGLIENAIGEHVKKTSRQNEVGGPISILRITKDAITWIRNEPPMQRWQVTEDFLRDVRSERIKLTIIPPFSIDFLERLTGRKTPSDK